MSTIRASTAASAFRRLGNPLPLKLAIPRLARLLWPVKTAAELAVRAGVSERACHYVLAGQAGLSGEALAALLRSDEGFEVLEALMAGAPPPHWWKRFRRTVQLGAMREELEAQRRRIAATAEAIAEFERDAAERTPGRK